MRSSLFGLVFVGFVTMFLSTGVCAQSRDFLTDDEIELVRDAQDIDLRIMVLTHAIDRRLTVLKIGVDAGANSPKENEKWGPVPTGSRLDLLTDVRRLLQKAIDDIDDTAAHRGTKMERTIENPTNPKKKDKEKSEPPFARAIKLLSTAAQRYKTLLMTELDKTKEPKEQGAIQASLEFCGQIIEAASKPLT